MQVPLFRPSPGADTVAIEREGSAGARARLGGGDVVAENAIDLLPVLRERQSQPKQHDMIAALSRAFDHAVERNAPLRHAVMNAAPIGGAWPGKTSSALNPHLLSVDLVEPCAREPEGGLGGACS